ncbi:S9 family peptidase [Brevundimonas sp. AAP58]|uniref:alpha/beta hydrolase family protein n=1 Tax=Brevundimonas sp. AAP58 TaxID=1523422 RepID=UPI000AD94B4B|nr:S9 family peptidase [Brevundimonas sp. AAP58]
MSIIPSRWTRSAVVAFMAASLAAGSAAATTLQEGECLPPEGARTTGPAPLSVYGSLPATDLVDVSPSGRRLAYIAVIGEERSMVICDLETLRLIGGVRAGDVKVRALDWIGEDHVMLTTTATQSGTLTGLQRSELAEGQIYSIETRRVAKALDATPGVFPRLVGTYIRGDELIVGGAGYDGLGLYRINLTNGRGETRVLNPEREGGSYLLNADAAVIARVTFDPRSKVWTIQRRVTGGWRDIWRTEAPIDAPSLVSFGRTDREVVIRGGQDSEYDQLRLLNLDTGEWSDLPFTGRPTGILVHPRTRLLIGASTQGDGEVEMQFLDTEAERAWNTVRAAFRGRRARLSAWSDDLRVLVVMTEGAGDPGTYHVVDLNRRTAEVFGETYPLSPDQVGEVRVISYPAADGLRIPGYLTLPPGVTEPRGLPLVVLPHGGPQSRDYLGFDWWAQAMASRGYAVLQPNFRGSDGLGRAHLEAGYGEWGLKMQTDLSDGVRWLASEGIVDPGRVCIVGASYGGYAAMAGPTLDQGVYRCAVSVAGVSDLRAMVQWEAEQGRRDSPVVQYWNRFMGADRLGDRSLDDRSPAAQAARADAPILLLHGRDDTVVPFTQSQRLADALQRAGRPYEFVTLDGEDHWLSRADTRTRMLNETLRFLETHNPAR